MLIIGWSYMIQLYMNDYNDIHGFLFSYFLVVCFFVLFCVWFHNSTIKNGNSNKGVVCFNADNEIIKIQWLNYIIVILVTLVAYGSRHSRMDHITPDFLNLSSTNLIWSILEYFDSYTESIRLITTGTL